MSVGHNVTIHGATIKDYALVRMGSTILDHAIVGEGANCGSRLSGIRATPLLKQDSIWGGVPAKFQEVDPAQAKELNEKIAHNYLMYSNWYKEQ